MGNSKILQDFEWFSGNSQNFGGIHGLPVRLTEHLLQDFQCRPWGGGGGDIFWSSPMRFSIQVENQISLGTDVDTNVQIKCLKDQTF